VRFGPGRRSLCPSVLTSRGLVAPLSRSADFRLPSDELVTANRWFGEALRISYPPYPLLPLRIIDHPRRDPGCGRKLDTRLHPIERGVVALEGRLAGEGPHQDLRHGKRRAGELQAEFGHALIVPTATTTHHPRAPLERLNSSVIHGPRRKVPSRSGRLRVLRLDHATDAKRACGSRARRGSAPRVLRVWATSADLPGSNPTPGRDRPSSCESPAGCTCPSSSVPCLRRQTRNSG